MYCTITVFTLFLVHFVTCVDGLQTIHPFPIVSRSSASHDRSENSQLEFDYWFDPRIHTLGNVGFTGAFHAAVAPLCTNLIDFAAYDDLDVRKQLACRLNKSVRNKKSRVVDLCCGVGFSSRALQQAFGKDSEVIGIDTSTEMISMANFITHHVQTILSYLGRRTSFKNTKHIVANAEQTNLESGSCDLVTIMYAFHEVPREGRDAILREARRLLRAGGTLAIVDITSDYVPPPSMLLGEPYVREYQANIHHQLRHMFGFTKAKYETVVAGNVGMWTMKRTAN